MSKRKLLLADDSLTVQKVVNLAFESEDIEVITAHDGNSAFEKFVEFSPDLVMADINLPGANGYEICRQIKQDEETKHIPVILLVGSFTPFSEEKAEKVGAEGFLKKPFQSIGLLINKVTELLDMNESDESEADFNEADTQPKPESPETTESAYSMSDDLGETGMDDEMIETESGPDYSFADETSKYETSTGFDVAEDSKRTQPMTYAEVEELGLMSQVEETAEETVYELADEPDAYPSTTSFNFGQESDEQTEDSSENQADSYEEYSAYQKTEDTETESFPASQIAAALELDDFELLELPPLETPDESVSTADESAESTAAAESEQTETDYSDQAETTAEDSYSIPQTAQSFETEENFESSEMPESETAEFGESYYAPETQTEEDNSFAGISASSTEESTERDFTEPETRTETAIEMQEMIATTHRDISRTSDNKVVVHYLPPEVIDEIAERVVEKLAEKLRR